MVDVKRYVGEGEHFETLIVSTPKAEVDYVITKAENGYSQYRITLTKGSAPNELSGMFTTPDVALKAVEKHLSKKRWTQAAKNKETAKRVEERKRKRNASELLPDSEDSVQQGSTH